MLNEGGKRKRRSGRRRIYASSPSKPWTPPPKKKISPSADKIIARLPSMSLVETVGVWRNAVQALGTKEKAAFHAVAQQVLDAVEDEWLRRQLDPASQDGFFKWPSTDAPVGNGDVTSDGWMPEGVLGFLEYRAGKSADLPGPLRQSILRRAFEGILPPAFPKAYLDQWGEPGSSQRLRKMAESIAAFARNAKRRSDTRFDQAIADWESDLEYLYFEFYVRRFGFAWPSTRLQ